MPAPVRTRRAFSALARSRDRTRSGPVRVTRVEDPGMDRVEVAYAIGRAVGGAVARNRLRRRLRVLMRELDDAGELAQGRYLVGATPAAAEESFGGLRTHLRAALGARR